MYVYSIFVYSMQLYPDTEYIKIARYLANIYSRL